ncbi:MoaD/ThiS family protein [Desulfopila sp. IMCC35008]|uniref:MoaD/ThiS family protein n=1 Tax=Desulfopila sp. IMCC35008 TaxID=2653858 RepID=UPI0013D8DEE0|nr:MoaD/ThiS family protein [Desulfopila sp. IMCC35008]
MIVTVKLFAYFRDNRFAVEERELPDNTKVGDVIDSLGIDREETGVLMLNSRHCFADTELSEGDILAIFPVIGGG